MEGFKTTVADSKDNSNKPHDFNSFLNGTWFPINSTFAPQASSYNSSHTGVLSHNKASSLFFMVGSLLLQALGILLNAGTLFLLLKGGWSKARKNILLVNLAFSDLLISTAVLTLITTYYGTGISPGNDTGCKLFAFLFHFLGASSIYTMVAIAIERYFSVTGGKHDTGSFSRHKDKMILVSWITSLVISTLPLLGWSSYRLDLPTGVCSIDWRHEGLSERSYIIFIDMVTIIVPISLQAIAYVRLYNEVCAAAYRVRYRRSYLLKSTLTFMTIGTLQATGDDLKNRLAFLPHEKGSDVKNQQRLARVMVSMVGFLTLTWMPFAISLILVGFVGISPKVLVVTQFLPTLNVVYDPILYVFHNRNLRRNINSYFSPVICRAQRSWPFSLSSSHMTLTATERSGSRSQLIPQPIIIESMIGMENTQGQCSLEDNHELRVNAMASKRPSLFTIVEVSSARISPDSASGMNISPDNGCKVLLSGELSPSHLLTPELGYPDCRRGSGSDVSSVRDLSPEEVITPEKKRRLYRIGHVSLTHSLPSLVGTEEAMSLPNVN